MTDEIRVTSEMIDAGLRELSIVGDAFASASALTGSDLKAVYIAMRQLESSDRIGQLTLEEMIAR